MTHNSACQHWLLLGTAPASEKVWALRKIAFPCGYFIPACAFSETGQPVFRPVENKDIWAMGGFAFEIESEGKFVEKNAAAGMIKGYRPWFALFHNVLIDELHERKHTIEVWDQGVSIFYGLWQESCQSLGELIPPKSFQDLVDQPVILETDAGPSVGSTAGEYAHSAVDVIVFMTNFMTLEPDDKYILGPLVAQQITPVTKHVAFSAGSLRFEVRIC